MTTLSVQFVDSISAISATDWRRLIATDYPFLQYDFLQLLESERVTHAESGWRVSHVTVFLGNELVACAPLYLKTHSYGEYVFDHAWADAYYRYGRQYYPKFVTAIPYTPLTGPRIVVANHLSEGQQQAVMQRVVEEIINLARREGVSSWHLLFPTPKVSQRLMSAGLMQRRAVHFQWFNRNYRDFDHFLQHFSARKRKQVKRERARIKESGITLEPLRGAQINESMWRQFYRFYQLTYAKRSGHGGYLPVSFFHGLGEKMADNLLMLVAKRNDQCIAASLFLFDQDCLYGRYWGASEDVEFLHFECCYYQGIEFCIQQRLSRFDPGVQGEHKIQRGFEPVFTYSNHWVDDPEFRQGIAAFLQEEEQYVREYSRVTYDKLPFNSDTLTNLIHHRNGL